EADEVRLCGNREQAQGAHLLLALRDRSVGGNERRSAVRIELDRGAADVEDRVAIEGPELALGRYRHAAVAGVDGAVRALKREPGIAGHGDVEGVLRARELAGLARDIGAAAGDEGGRRIRLVREELVELDLLGA